MTRELLTMEAVALKLGRGREWFWKHWRTLISRHRFPKPVPGLGKRWDPMAIDCWLDSHIDPAFLAARARAAGEPPIAGPDHSTLLEDRAERLAREVH